MVLNGAETQAYDIKSKSLVSIKFCETVASITFVLKESSQLRFAFTL